MDHAKSAKGVDTLLERYIKYDIERMVREYDDNKATLVSLKEQYKEVCEFDISGMAYDKDRVQTSPKADGIANIVIRRLELEEKINGAERFLSLYEMAWDRLTDKEKFILSEFYQRGYERRQDAIDTLCDEYGIETAQVYNLKTDAVSRLKRLMFG
jgi:hypothetical protein